MKEFLSLIYALILIAVGSCIAGGDNSALCEGWVCVGPCGIDAQCGPNCVCVGASTGAGKCMSR